MHLVFNRKWPFIFKDDSSWLITLLTNFPLEFILLKLIVLLWLIPLLFELFEYDLETFENESSLSDNSIKLLLIFSFL